MSASPQPPADPESLLPHLEDLRRWCRQRSSDPHLAEDVAQETLLAALTHLRSIRDPSRLRGWLFRVAQRRLADEVRRRRGELPLTIEPPAPADFPAPPIDAGQMARVRTALRRLPIFLRRPVRLHYLQGRPLREVALSLRTTVNGIKARLYRARRILREEARR
ncbi:MAG: RNA polymerase sigma factor [Planctomycetota bacterium]|jgi:RNA polymerase sigma-70 factor (ECF subfamily)